MFSFSNNRTQDSPSTISRIILWIWTACKLVVTKLFYLPFLLMFLPVDLILRPNTRFAIGEKFNDAKEKNAFQTISSTAPQ